MTAEYFFQTPFFKIIIKLHMMNHLYHEGFEGRESTCNYCQIPMEQRRLTSQNIKHACKVD